MRNRISVAVQKRIEHFQLFVISKKLEITTIAEINVNDITSELSPGVSPYSPYIRPPCRIKHEIIANPSKSVVINTEL